MKYTETDGGLLVPCQPKVHQFDGLVNIASGLGTAKSKLSHMRWHYDATDWASLDAMYQSNWIARAIVDEWAADAVREWRSIKSGWSEEIESVEKSLCVKQHVQEAIGWARLYGGAGIVMITNQDLEKPLNLNKIKKGDLEKLLVFDRHDLTPSGDVNTFDLLSPNYMRPDFYTVSGGSQRIHHSHIAFFNGAKLPKRQSRVNFGWGDSELRRCINEINDMVSSKGGIAELMQEANIDVVTRTGLTDELTTDQDESIIKRYELFSLMKSTINMALLDGDEKLDRQTLNLSGVAPVLETFMIWIAGCARMPVTKIFGTSASGLNATGEGDRKNYYDSIRGQQNGDLSLSMRQIDEVLVRSAVGNFPDDYDYQWNPLEQLDGVQVAQAQLLAMQKHSLAVQNNFATRSQVMRNLQSSEEYQYLGGVIDELEGMEDGSLFDDVDNEPEPEPDPSGVVRAETSDGWITVKPSGEVSKTREAQPKSKSLDADFVESEHPRDENGRFASSASSASASDGKTQRANGDTREERLEYARGAGFDVDNILVHATNNKALTEIKKTGNFYGIFALPADEAWQAENYGNEKYEIAIKGNVWDDGDISSAISDNYEVAISEAAKSASGSYSGDISDIEDDLIAIIDGSSMEQTEELMEFFGSFDEGDFFKDAQNLRMRVASALGAPAIKMEDEFGDDTIAILPGDSAMIIGKQQ